MAYLGRTELKSSDIQLKASVTISGSSTNTVVLAWTAPNEQSLILKVNGVVQHTDAYSIAGSPTTITLASGNFADAAVVEVVGINDIGKAIVPADGSVTVLKLADDAVTEGKLATTGTPDGSKFLQDDMAWTAVPASGGFDSIAPILSSQSYTIPADMTKQVFYVTGGGGGGGGADAALGAGGGAAGGTVIKSLSLAAGTTMDIVIGAVAAGGSAGVDGTIGVDTTVTYTSVGTSFTTLTGPGGKPGRYGNPSIAPTIPSGGDMNIAGGGSSHERGGSSYWGGGGSGGNTAVASLPGEAYGSGGGAGYPSGASYYPGRQGALGIVVIYLYK